MTDVHPAANDQMPRAEFTPRDLPSPSEIHEFQQTADPDGAPEVVTPVLAGSGSANAEDEYPGVVPPADWFQQAPEEAAPSGQPVAEPVRPENKTSAAVVPAGSRDDSRLPDYPASDGCEYDYLTSANYPAGGWESAREWESVSESEPAPESEPAGGWEVAPESEPAGGWEPAGGSEPAGGWEPAAGSEPAGGWEVAPESEPAGGWEPAGGSEPAGGWEVEQTVGPTEARWGRPGGPGFTVPQGTRYGLYDPEGRSGWQLSQDLWQDSGIVWETSEGLEPDETSLPWKLPAPDTQSLAQGQPTASMPTSSDVQLTPMLQPMTSPQPVAEDQSPRETVPAETVPAETVPAETVPAETVPAETVPAETVPAETVRHEVIPREGSPDRSTRPESILSETAPPLGAPTAGDTLPRREGRPARPEPPQPRQDPQPPVPLPPGTSQKTQIPQQPQRPWHPQPQPISQPLAPPLPQRPVSQEQLPQRPLPQRPSAQVPLPQVPTQPRPPERQSVPQQQMPWEEPRRATQARRGGRGRSHWQAARVGVPIVVILAVGAGALALLTGKAHEALQRTGSQGSAPGTVNPQTFSSSAAAQAATAGGESRGVSPSPAIQACEAASRSRPSPATGPSRWP